MGAETSTESGEEFLRSFQSKYSFHKEINDSRFGDIQIYKENGGEGFVFLKSQWCQSEEDYNNFLKQCNKRINNPHRNVLKMIGFTQSSDTQLCGDFSKITVYYEYFGHNMERELDRRHNRSEFFNEQEIWFLLESIISAGAFFQQQKMVHGDIRPQNILLTNEGFVKIADQGLLNSDKNGYIKASQYGEQAYLSPAQMRGLQNREINPAHNAFKSDVYSLGMTMLEVCCLYTARSCYDYGSSTIIKPVVEDLQNRARQRYSNFLMNIISELLQEDEANRPSFVELQTLLIPYQDAIQNLQPFTPQYQLGKSPQQVLGQSVVAPVQVVQQQPQAALYQSQIQPPQQPQQQVGVQSQIIYANNTQPYIQSPERQHQQQQQQQQVLEQQQIPVQQQQVTVQQQLQPQQQQVEFVTHSGHQPQQQQVFQQQVPQQVVQQQQPVQFEQAVYQPQQQQAFVQQQQQPINLSPQSAVKYAQSVPQQPINLSPQSNVKYAQNVPQQQQVVQTQYVPQQQIYQQQPVQQQQQQQQFLPQQYVQQQPQQIYQQQPQYVQQNGIGPGDNIDQRVKDALKTSEETILRHSNRLPPSQQY